MGNPDDPDAGKRITAGLMLFAAVILGTVAFVMWAPANDQANKTNDVNQIETSLDGVIHDTVKPNHTASLACAGAGAVVFLGSIILFAGAESRPAVSSAKQQKKKEE